MSIHRSARISNLSPLMRSMVKGKFRAGIVFGGGPAPGCNAVIEYATHQFRDRGIPVIGFYDGFEWLQKVPPADFKKNRNPVFFDDPYFIRLTTSLVAGIRREGGILIRTSRANPGKDLIKSPADFHDAKKTLHLRNVLATLETLGVRILVTVGGDDTLKTAYYLASTAAVLGQELRIAHAAKTIDADYPAAKFADKLPWTFGFFTAAEVGGQALRNLWRDARSTSSYFIVRLMGRSAGWLTAATAIHGNACMALLPEEFKAPIDLDSLSTQIARAIVTREKHGKRYGVIAVSEGLAAKLPDKLKPTKADRHDNVVMGSAEVERHLENRIAREYERLRSGLEKKIMPKEVGYEVRSADPNSYDVMLGGQLGRGAFNLLDQGRQSILVTARGAFDIDHIPFEELIGDDMRVIKRVVDPSRDFYQLLLASQSPDCVETLRDGFLRLEGGER